MKSEERKEFLGSWKLISGELVPDATETEIDEFLGKYLAKVATSADGWTSLYVDNSTGFYWELSFTDSSQFGGGARRLRRLDAIENPLQWKQSI